ncbi:serine/threonine protein kinase [Solihabitans fulvus]|uniref:Serine/threonine protein kinase n=1 Tax=Solihabitans fulvus TaxID=1892852 RepID=A0A5B2WRB5_9PSEU|nr:serine/threonine-protein kinase [Solihabitans fulvus]KAA2254523.1 serine/threonine protein kinase [Solihabitans fulvus]
MASHQGQLVDDRYRLGTVLGVGGMAEVHRAWDLRLSRAVAVKLFAPGADEVARRRFEQEARVLAGLTHPGLVTVFDAGVSDGRGYLVMRLVDGPTLRAALDDGPLGPARTLRLGAALAAALAHVHQHRIIHRDLKPSNVLLGPEEEPYLADFGISLLADTTRLTQSGQFMGTAAYLAPEQVRGTEVGPPADVYALGLVLLECLTGRPEYRGTGVEVAMARLSRRPRVPWTLPRGMGDVLSAMTATKSDHRPDAAECARRLTAVCEDLPADGAATPGDWTRLPHRATARLSEAVGAPLTGARRVVAVSAGLLLLTGATATALLLSIGGAGHGQSGAELSSQPAPTGPAARSAAAPPTGVTTGNGAGDGDGVPPQADVGHDLPTVTTTTVPASGAVASGTQPPVRQQPSGTAVAQPQKDLKKTVPTDGNGSHGGDGQGGDGNGNHGGDGH